MTKKKKSLIIDDWMIDETTGGPEIIVFYTVMSICVIFVLSGVGIGQQIPAMGVSTYSTIHNVGLMKLMGQNTVSILKGTKHLTRLLGLCPATVTD